jgi:hypothetical protein
MKTEQNLLRSAGRSFCGFEVREFVLGAGGTAASHGCPVENLLRLTESSFNKVEVFEDCSGGNSRLSYLSGVGGGTFLIRKSCFLGCLFLLFH